MIVLATMPDPSGGRAARAYAISSHRMNSYTGGRPRPPASTGHDSDNQPRSPSARYSARTAVSCSASWKKNPSTGPCPARNSTTSLRNASSSGASIGFTCRCGPHSGRTTAASRFSANARGPSLQSGWSQCIRNSAQPYSMAWV